MKAEIDWRGKKEEKRLYWKVREERKQLVRERFALGVTQNRP
jgi:hypothetical protein